MATTNTGERSEATQSFFVYVRDQNTGQIKSVAIPGDVQVGLNGNPADLTLLGRFSIAATNYNTDNVNKGLIQASPDDTIIGISRVITPISGRIRVNLPATPREGELHFIKDMTETSDVTPIDIYPASNQTIDNQAFVTLADPNGSLALVYFNGNWRRLVAGLGASGGAGASADLSYVTINSEPSLTHERHLTGSANVVMTDLGPKSRVYFDLSAILGAGAGTYTYATVTADAFGRITGISAGTTPPPPGASYLTALNEPALGGHRQMSGGLGTTVIDTGAGGFFTYNIDTRIIPFLTASNIFTGPNTFNAGITGSITQLPAGHGAYIIGTGGTTVTTGAFGQVIINSTNTGGGGTVDPNAPIVVTFQTGSVPAGRNIVGGPGISIQDNGPGHSLIVGFTPLSSQSANTYDGYCTGSLNWTATVWTDFTAVPGNFFDVIQNGITRSGATFTVNTTGYYYWRSTFNFAGASRYIGFRLSGSNGTLLQRTTFDGNVADNDAMVEGVVQLNSGSTFKLQYCTVNGSSNTWGVLDPLNGENMRTGHITMFRIADPVTIQNVPTSQPFGWQTAYFVDFTIQASGTYGGNGTVVYNGVPWHIENYGNSRAMGILPVTNGLEISCNTANTDFGFAGARSAPLLSLKMSEVFPSFDYSTMPFRIWCLLGPNNIANNSEAAFIAIERWGLGGGANSQAYTEKKIATPLGFQAQAALNNANIFNETVDTSNTGDDVIMLQWLDDRQLEYWTGVSVSGTFPSDTTMRLRGTALISNATFFQSPITGSLDFGLVIGAVTNNTLGVLNVSFKQFKFEYFASNPGGILSNTIITASWQAPDQFDYLWWPCNDIQGPYVLNYGTAGAIGHLTASSTSVKYNQEASVGGPVKNSIGVNTNGGTNAYLGILNTATQPTPSASNITISAWFRPDLQGGTSYSLNNNHQKIIVKSYFNTVASWNSPFITLDLGLAGTGNGEMEYGMAGPTSGGPVNNATGSCCTYGAWNHAGWSYDGVQMRCYLNGQLIYQVPTTGLIDYSQNGWWALGGNQAIPNTEYFQGQICDVRVANTVRSPAWFAQQWAAGRPDANGLISLSAFVSGVGGVANITGSGGTSVSTLLGLSTVSSSIGADLYGSYLTVNKDAQDPNARVIQAGSGISFTDTGPGGTFTIASTGGGGSIGSGSNTLLNAVSASLQQTTTIATGGGYTTLCSVTSSWTDVEIWGKVSGIVGTGANTLWTKIQIDNLDNPQLGTFTEVVNNGAGFGTELHGLITGLAPGTHTFTLMAKHGGGQPVTIHVPGSFPPHEGASILVMNLTASSGQIPFPGIYYSTGSNTQIAALTASYPSSWTVVSQLAFSVSGSPGTLRADFRSTLKKNTNAGSIYAQVFIDDVPAGFIANDFGPNLNATDGFRMPLIGSFLFTASAGSHVAKLGIATDTNNAVYDNFSTGSATYLMIQEIPSVLVGTGGSGGGGGGGGSDFDWIDGGNQIRSTSSVSVSDGTENAFAGQKGTDVYFYVSGTIGLSGSAARKALFGGDTVFSGSVSVGIVSGSSGSIDFDGNVLLLTTGVYVSGSVTAQLGFTGSLTQTTQGLPYIVAIGSVTATTNSLGQIILSGSGGGGSGGGGTTIIVSGTAAQGQAAYYGYVTSSVWWNQTGSWTPYLQAVPDGIINDVITQSIVRNGSTFTFLNGGLYSFHAGFNAYGSDAYIALRLNGVSSSHGIAFQRTTYRTSPSDQNLVVLDGVFSASIGDIWTLEYISSGTVFPWTGSIFPGGIPGGNPSRSGEVSIFMLPTNVQQVPPATINVLTASLLQTTTLTSAYLPLCSVTASFTDVEVWGKISGVVSGPNTVWTKIQVDNVDVVNLGTLNETINNGAGFGTQVHGRITGLTAGTHVFTLLAKNSSGSGPTINVPGTNLPHEGATLTVMNLTASNPGVGSAPKAPLYSIPILAGTVATNTSFPTSKQSLGMCFFNPVTVQGFGGTSRRYFFRAVLDEFTIETNMSAAIDLNDFNGIVAFPPSTIPGSIMSTSSGTAVQLTAELTSVMQFVTGSGLLEARLWRTVSGSLASLATCRNARLDVEFS
jgi:hypothetical protein